MTAPTLNTAPDIRDCDRLTEENRLLPGSYWRALPAQDDPNKAAAGKNIVPGLVYCIGEIKLVDDTPHTVVLRDHPKFKTNQRYAYKFSILVAKFLECFDTAFDGEEIRREEMQAIQERIAQVQAELTQTTADPVAFRAQIEAELDAKEAEQARALPVPTAPQEIHTDPIHAEGVAGALLLSGNLTHANLDRLVGQTEREVAIATAQSQWIASKSQEMSKALAELAPYFSEKAEAMAAKLAPTLEKYGQIQKGLNSLYAYVGRDVEVRTIRTGKPAPAEDLVHLFQSKLYVDEEIAVYTNFDNGKFDFQNLAEFDAELIRNPRFMEQLLPVPRCVRLLTWRRKSKNYGTGNAFYEALMNDENKRTWLLIRNGDNVHAVESPIASHNHSDRLFPTESEMQDIFKEWGDRMVTVNDVGYADKIKEHDNVALHYKRFAILLAGLQDRENLLGDFPITVSPGKLLKPDVVNQVFRFIYDDAPSLTDGAPSLREWVKTQNAYLRPGSRIMIVWRSAMTLESCPGVVKYRPNHRFDSDEEFTADPVEWASIVTVSKDGETLVAHGEMTKYVYRRDNPSGDRIFKARVDLLEAIKSSGSQFPFLCLDRVKAAEIHRYIHDRQHRADYLSYLSLFKTIYDHLTEVEAYEAPFRSMLRTALDEADIGEPEIRDSLIDEAIASWRATNYGRMLPKPTEPSYKRICKVLLDALYILADAGTRDRIEAASTLAHSLGRTPLRLALTGSRKLILYTAPLPEEALPEATVQPDPVRRPRRVSDEPIPQVDIQYPWTKRFTLAERKSKLSVTAEAWAITEANTARETVLHDFTDTTPWLVDFSKAKSYERLSYTYEQLQTCLAAPAEALPRLTQALAGHLDFSRLLAELETASACGVLSLGNFLLTQIGFPIGHCQTRARLFPLILGLPVAWVLNKATKTEAEKEQVRVALLKRIPRWCYDDKAKRDRDYETITTGQVPQARLYFVKFAEFKQDASDNFLFSMSHRRNQKERDFQRIQLDQPEALSKAAHEIAKYGSSPNHFNLVDRAVVLYEPSITTLGQQNHQRAKTSQPQ